MINTFRELNKMVKAGRKTRKTGETSSSTGSKKDDSYEDEDHDNLTNKKREYLQEAILDKTGVFSYLDDPREYKRARK